MPRTWIPAPAKGMGVGDTGVEFASKLRGVSFTNDGALMVLPGQSLIPASAWTDFGLPIKVFSARTGNKHYLIIGVLDKKLGSSSSGSYYKYYVRIYNIDEDSYTDISPTSVGGFSPYNIPIFNPYSSSTVPYAFIGAWSSDGSIRSKKIKLDSSITILNLGIEAPTQAPSAAAGASGALDGTYYFRYTYYDSSLDIESNGSPASNAVTVANQNVDLSNITGTGEPGVDKIRIYGLGGSVTEYMLIATIDNPGEGQTTTYTVSTAESEWGQNIPTDHDPPPSDVVYLEWNEQLGRLFAIDDDGRLWWSSSWQPDYWPTDNYIDTGLELLALATFRGTTYAFTKDETYQVIGPINDQFELRKVADIGVIGPAALTVIPTGIMMVTPAKSVILFVGGIGKSIGEPIEGILKAEELLTDYYGYNFWTVSTAGDRGVITFAEIQQEAGSSELDIKGIYTLIVHSDGQWTIDEHGYSAFCMDPRFHVPHLDDYPYLADITAYSYDNISLDVSSQTSYPVDVGFNPDGDILYVLGTDTNRIYQYSLSTPWDISTATYTGKSFDFGGQDDGPWSFAFKPDGSKLYVLGLHNKDVYQYSLSTPWDISTASYDNVSYSVGSEDPDVYALYFKPDGTAFYVAGASNNAVFQYSLSTPWDISTASYTGKSGSAGTDNPSGLSFSSDGSKCYVTDRDDDRVLQHTLSTSWDISTAQYDKALDISGQDTNPWGNCFSQSGHRLYVAGDATDKIYQYSAPSYTVPWNYRKGLCAIAVKPNQGPYLYPLGLQSVYPDDSSPSPDSSNLIQSNRIFPAGPGRKFRLRGFKFKVHKVQGTPKVSITLKVDGGGTGKEYSKNNISITTDYGALGTFYPTTNLIGHYLNYEVYISSNIAKFYGLEIEWEPIGGATEPASGGITE